MGTNKKQQGMVGFYNGMPVEILTTRAFRFDNQLNQQIRGVELLQLESMHPDEIFKIADGKYCRKHWINDIAYLLYFVPIVEFRKHFVYNDTAQVLYGRRKEECKTNG